MKIDAGIVASGTLDLEEPRDSAFRVLSCKQLLYSPFDVSGDLQSIAHPPSTWDSEPSLDLGKSSRCRRLEPFSNAIYSFWLDFYF